MMGNKYRGSRDTNTDLSVGRVCQGGHARHWGSTSGSPETQSNGIIVILRGSLNRGVIIIVFPRLHMLKPQCKSLLRYMPNECFAFDHAGGLNSSEAVGVAQHCTCWLPLSRFVFVWGHCCLIEGGKQVSTALNISLDLNNVFQFETCC
jgi:hypothetical protein